MYRLIIFLWFFLLTDVASSQMVYQKTLKETFDKAKMEGKPIFVCIMTSKWVEHLWPMGGLRKSEVQEFYNKTFINFRCYAKDSVALALLQNYPVAKGSPNNLYFDSEAHLVYQSIGITPDTKAYIAFANEALEKISVAKLNKVP